MHAPPDVAQALSPGFASDWSPVLLTVKVAAEGAALVTSAAIVTAIKNLKLIICSSKKRENAQRTQEHAENPDVLPTASVAFAVTTQPPGNALPSEKLNDPSPLALVVTDANPMDKPPRRSRTGCTAA